VDVTDSLTFDADTRRTDPNGHSYDTRYTLAYEGKKLTLEGTVTGKADLHDRDCILDRMNAAERQIVKLFAGTPVVYRMEGEASLTLTPAGGQARRLEGTALMESIVLGND
jgi:hypothetical protein